VVSCPACFTRPDVQRLWLAFGDRGELGGMSAGGGP